MDRKNWLMNVLWGALAMLVPIVGPIVYDGWLYEVIESLHNDPEHKDYRDFDLNRFTEYLTRGIWPFLVHLIMQAIMMVPIFIMYFVMVAIAIAAAQSKAAALAIFVYLLFFALLMVVIVVANFIAWPASLYAGLSRGFNFQGIIAFVKDFNKRALKEVLLSILFMLACAIVLVPAGMIVFCVGMYFAAAAVTMAQHHLQFQLYELYLQRGGTPIPLAASTTAAPPPPPPRDNGAPDERFRAAP
jgi:hypothetical protein